MIKKLFHSRQSNEITNLVREAVDSKVFQAHVLHFLGHFAPFLKSRFVFRVLFLAFSERALGVFVNN